MTHGLNQIRQCRGLGHAPSGTVSVDSPPRLRVLYITVRQRLGAWLAEDLLSDESRLVSVDEVQGVSPGMARLRDEVFDVVLLAHDSAGLDALAFTQAMRAGGAEEAVVVLGEQSEPQMSVGCFEAGADAYVCVHTATSEHLRWVIARATERQQLIRQNRRLTQAEEQRLAAERTEAQRLLAQLQQLTAEAAAERTEIESECPLPLELVTHYRQMLRAYVIMGSGHLRREVSQMAELLAKAGVSGRQLLELHLYVLEDTIIGLGNRSSRHVLHRADLLGMEVIMRLADCYRRQYRDRKLPPRQKLLPGFDHFAPSLVAPHGSH